MPDEEGNKLFANWRLDRIRLQAKGDTFQAWIGGKEVFPGGVKDGETMPPPSFGLVDRDGNILVAGTFEYG